MSASIDGLDSIKKGFNEALKKIGNVNAKAFADVCLDLLGQSVALAPVDTGDLRGSGSVTINSQVIAEGTKEGSINVVSSIQDSSELSAEVGFSEKYAVRQHEHTEYKHPQGGQAKYLEQPFRQKSKKYIQYIADANSDALK